MKLLFDQNLSRRLTQRLADIFPDASHVVFHDLENASDAEIWKFAQSNGYCIVSQDADFAERSRIFGAPPKLVWLRCGNRPASRIEMIIRENSRLVSNLAADDTLSYVELY